MKERGQVTIEGVLIIGILLAIFLAVSIPLAFRTKDNARDVSLVADARYVTERIATAANSIVHPDEKRTIDIYVPAFSSQDENIPVTITTDGDSLITYIQFPTETKNITIDLYGTNWSIYDGSTGNAGDLAESSGGRYTITITWANITYWRQ